ncbi:unnamed protein product [Cylindrotheca closterium]|uniref:Uncharacterized protein n=1 Tax=Cylindrotheca closterium TaxID=2856 RepID=A0AAD2CLM0_9STRA|nr:unnamed protein product [Cylindrotheca closterium]
MPPAARWALGQGDALKGDCQKQTVQGVFYWEPDLTACDHNLAARLFELVFAKQQGNDVSLWLPKLDSEANLKSLVEIVNRNSERLGDLKLEVSSWPAAPATKLSLTWNTKNDQSYNSKETTETTSSSQIQASIKNTEKWVEEKLCGLSLCPYTSSLQKAAVGLGSAGVAEGPIVIRHSAPLLVKDDDRRMNPTTAATLAHAFWQGVQELATLPEEEVATLLILAPTKYDDNFVEFAAIFDDLLEPSIQATGSENIVGRALFHPTYDSKILGHQQLLPGHALPANMVDRFFDQYLSTMEGAKPDLESIANANDAVRWTPHATINLLRRSQLTAAKEVEAASPKKKPNWIYARNVLRILKTDSSLSSTGEKEQSEMNR